MSKPLLYLASPYSSPYSYVRRYRFVSVCMATAELLRRGFLVYSPIAASVPIVEQGGFGGTDWKSWKEFDERMISVCTELWVLKLHGWKESIGVTAEIEIAEQLEKPVWYVDCGRLTVEPTKD